MDFNLIMYDGCLTLKETIITSANLEHLIGFFLWKRPIYNYSFQ